MTPDPNTLKHLKELSSKRRAIEESVNDSSTNAVAREMSGGSTSRCQQDLQKIEQYMPLLENLLFHVKLIGNNPQMVRWTSNLNIRWSSALGASNVLKLMCSKFYHVDDLHFEHGMTLFLYGAILRETAVEVLSRDLVQAATLYRKAAGVYSYLAEELLPQLQPALPQDRPPEAISSLSSIMSLICLVEAQAVTIRKAEEKGSTGGLLAKLHYGIKLLLDEAITTLHSSKKQLKTISPRLEDFIYYCGALNELRSQKYFAEVYKDDNQIGFAVGILCHALHKRKEKMPGDESWRLIFKKEIDGVGEMLRKLEHENEFVWHDKIPSSDQLPSLEGKKIVSALPYSPQRLESKLVFKI